MAAITAYTTTEAIRGAVGITAKDLPDALLTDQNLDVALASDMYEWVPTYAAIYTAGKAGGATAAEAHAANLIELYAQWFCAAAVVDRMILGIPHMISDGKSEMRRFANIDLEALAARVKGRRDMYRTKLAEEQGQAAVASTSIMGVSVPDYDPVTG